MKIKDIEAKMIHGDMDLCLALVNEYNAGISYLLIPYVSTIVLESAKYFSIHIDNALLNSIRAKTKQLDDNKTDVMKITSDMNKILINHNQYFQGLHKGFFAPLKKIIQPDIGITKYRKNILIGTTILSNYFVSESSNTFTMEQLNKKLLFYIAYELGSIIAELGNHGVNIERKETKLISENELTYSDHKSKKYYKSIFNHSIPIGIMHLIQLILSMINFVFYILNKENTNTFTLFKVRYITIYHAVSSLKKVQGYLYANRLINNESKKNLSKILGNPKIKLLANSQFRNQLVHYKTTKVDLRQLDTSLKFYGFVEYYFSGLSFNELYQTVNQALVYTSENLNSWMNNK